MLAKRDRSWEQGEAGGGNSHSPALPRVMQDENAAAANKRIKREEEMLGGDTNGGNPHPQMYGSNQPQHIAEPPYGGLTSASIVGPVGARAPVDIDVRDVTYRGEYKDGRPHGRGYKVWIDGDWYDGVKIWANGDRYEGEWREGMWENDLKHGAFTFTDERSKVFLQVYEEGKLVSSTLKQDQSPTTTFAHFVTTSQHWFSVFEENLKQLESKKLEVEQLRTKYEGRTNKEQELRAKIVELQTKLQLVQDENARLIGGGSERCTLGELQVLERTLERSRALVSTRISIMNSRVALAEKSRCLHCSEKSKEVVFVPCGHRALCQACATPVLLCPVCDVPIASKVVSYDT